MPPKKCPGGRAVAKAKEKAKEKAKAKAKERRENAILNARSRFSRATTAPRAVTSSGDGFVGLDSKAAVTMDVDVFARHPASVGLGGKQEHVTAFPGGGSKSGFACLLQRLSDYVYTVSAYCADPSRGARFTMFTPKKRKPQEVWLPPAGCGLGGKLAPNSSCVLDTVHLDLVRPVDGKTRLTKDALLTAVSSSITHLFLNIFRDAASTAAAITNCGGLQVVTLLECSVSPGVVEALATKGTSLRGVVFKGCYCDRLAVSDDCWARLFAAAQGLLWFQADFIGVLGPVYPISPQAWDHLPKSLHVFSYTGNVLAITGQRTGNDLFSVGHQPASDRDIVRAAAAKLPGLKWQKAGTG